MQRRYKAVTFCHLQRVSVNRGGEKKRGQKHYQKSNQATSYKKEVLLPSALRDWMDKNSVCYGGIAHVWLVRGGELCDVIFLIFWGTEITFLCTCWRKWGFSGPVKKRKTPHQALLVQSSCRKRKRDVSHWFLESHAWDFIWRIGAASQFSQGLHYISLGETYLCCC